MATLEEKTELMKKEYKLDPCPKCGSFIFEQEKEMGKSGTFEKCYFCDTQANKVIIKL